MELVLASIAAIIYLTVSAKQAPKARGIKIKMVSGMMAEESSSDTSPHAKDVNDLPDSELTLSQLALKAMRQGRMADAIALIQRSPEAIRRVPFDLACRLLITVAKTPKLSGMGADLKVFTGKISPQALDAAVLESWKGHDIAACCQLHILSGLLSINKSQQTFETLAQVYASDATALRVLVEEAGAPLWRSFAELALEQCARMKDHRLAADIVEKASGSDVAYLRA